MGTVIESSLKPPACAMAYLSEPVAHQLSLYLCTFSVNHIPSSAAHVKLTTYALAPIAWPTAKLLDRVLGKNDVHTYKKAELKSFLQFHRTGEEPLRDDEISILNGVLELNTKNVET